MKRTSEGETRVEQVRREMLRSWLAWGIIPLVAASLLVLALSGHAVWASSGHVDEHIVERGFQAVLAICAALFLTGFWLDGKWTNSERLAMRIRTAAGGDHFDPSRSQLSAQADIAFGTIRSSTIALTIIGGAIAVSAVISACAGLGVGQCFQLVLLGVCYQLFVLSRHPYYIELLSAAARGELVAPAPDHNRKRK